MPAKGGGFKINKRAHSSKPSETCHKQLGSTVSPAVLPCRLTDAVTEREQAMVTTARPCPAPRQSDGGDRLCISDNCITRRAMPPKPCPQPPARKVHAMIAAEVRGFSRLATLAAQPPSRPAGLRLLIADEARSPPGRDQTARFGRSCEGRSSRNLILLSGEAHQPSLEQYRARAGSTPGHDQRSAVRARHACLEPAGEWAVAPWCGIIRVCLDGGKACNTRLERADSLKRQYGLLLPGPAVSGGVSCNRRSA